MSQTIVDYAWRQISFISSGFGVDPPDCAHEKRARITPQRAANRARHRIWRRLSRLKDLRERIVAVECGLSGRQAARRIRRTSPTSTLPAVPATILAIAQRLNL